MQNSEVFGSRLTLRTPLGESNARLVWGGDYSQRSAPLDVFDPAAYDARRAGLRQDRQAHMPPLRTRSAGRSPSCSIASTNTGRSTAACATNTPPPNSTTSSRSPSPKAASPVTVKGGDLDDAVLSNLGIVYSPVAGQEIYASFSQGFQLPDVGIQLRNARRGFDIGSSNLEPVNQLRTRLARRHRRQHPSSLALFTTSKLGDVQASTTA